MEPPLKLVKKKIKKKTKWYFHKKKKKKKKRISLNSTLGINSVSITRDILPKLKPRAVLNGAVENTLCTQQTVFSNKVCIWVRNQQSETTPLSAFYPVFLDKTNLMGTTM